MFRHLKKFIDFNHSGSALLLSLFILTSIIVVAFSGATGVLSNVKISGAVTRSFRAYFAAEAGAERLLFEVRHNEYDLGVYSGSNIFSDTLSNGSSYRVDYKSFAPTVFSAVGSFDKVKRSVEISF